MGVSKNRGTPKSSILIGFSIINHPFWGVSPYFWKHPHVRFIFFLEFVDPKNWRGEDESNLISIFFWFVLPNVSRFRCICRLFFSCILIIYIYIYMCVCFLCIFHILYIFIYTYYMHRTMIDPPLSAR